MPAEQHWDSRRPPAHPQDFHSYALRVAVAFKISAAEPALRLAQPLTAHFLQQHSTAAAWPVRS